MTCRSRSCLSRPWLSVFAMVGAMVVSYSMAHIEPNSNFVESESPLAFENESTSNGIRGSSSAYDESPSRHRRLPVVRRLYGPENAHARRAAAEAEERIERYRTGLPGDPTHKIEYKNHPYDKVNRKLQDETVTDEVEEEEENEDPFRPIRIQFYTGALDAIRDGNNAARIDFIKAEILPRTADFWSKALSVVPISGKLLISTSELVARQYCGDAEFTEVPDSHISNGLDNTDLVLYVSGTPSSIYCGGSTLAVAVACNFDQFDRPIAGAINFCLNQIDLEDDGTASEDVISDNVDVSIHEAAHVLGMSSNSYRFFWDPETGEPRTPRPFETKTVTCVDGQQRSNMIVPDENTMKFFLAENGQRYASIVTPKVRTVARNQFNCQALAGAQLENQPTGSNSCTGDHWDERMFYPEALSGVISVTTNHLSYLTLALMEDTGWYKANYTMGRHSQWGLGAGCDFVTSQCLEPVSGGKPNIPEYSRGYFCNDGGAKGCSADLTHKLRCTVVDYDMILPRNVPESQFQYFLANPTDGGPRQADYCPVYGSVYDGRNAEQLACADSANQDDPSLLSGYYGENSTCFETNAFGGVGECYETRCVLGEGLRVNVDGEWLTCKNDFDELEVRVGPFAALPIKITCPRLSQACPGLFCPFNCAGRGVCNYAAVKDGITRPSCECFDTTDTTPGCSDSLVPDGGFLEDSTGLLNNVKENFFDPLVSVFVDHPDKWTTASWAWAAGLLVVFLLMILCICSSFWPERKSVPSNPMGRIQRSSPPPRRSPPVQRSAPRTTPSSTPYVQRSAPRPQRSGGSQLYDV